MKQISKDSFVVEKIKTFKWKVNLSSHSISKGYCKDNWITFHCHQPQTTQDINMSLFIHLVCNDMKTVRNVTRLPAWLDHQ